MGNAQIKDEFDDKDAFADELPPGSQLMHGQYTIEKFLNAGGFGITYAARDSLDRRIVIKECFPGAFCRRSRSLVNARSRAHQTELASIVRLFVQEARSLSKLNHPNIVGVHQVFEENNTAYMALDFVEGKDLLDVIEYGHFILEPSDVEAILRKVLDAVSFVHAQGVLHRDISPDNILLDGRKNPVLIDFGAAREQATKQSRVLSALRVVKDGYSPQEFYIAGSEQGPCSDLYALGATFYHLLTEELPENSQARLAAVAAGAPDPYKPLVGRIDGYDENFLRAIDTAMAILPKDRISSAQNWLAMMDGIALKSAPEEVFAVTEPSNEGSAPTKKKSGKGLLLATVAVVGIVAAGVVTQTDLLSGGSNETAATPNAPAATDVAAAAPEVAAPLTSSVRPPVISRDVANAGTLAPQAPVAEGETTPVSEKPAAEVAEATPIPAPAPVPTPSPAPVETVETAPVVTPEVVTPEAAPVETAEAAPVETEETPPVATPEPTPQEIVDALPGTFDSSVLVEAPAVADAPASEQLVDIREAATPVAPLQMALLMPYLNLESRPGALITEGMDIPQAVSAEFGNTTLAAVDPKADIPDTTYPSTDVAMRILRDAPELSLTPNNTQLAAIDTTPAAPLPKPAPVPAAQPAPTTPAPSTSQGVSFAGIKRGWSVELPDGVSFGRANGGARIFGVNQIPITTKAEFDAALPILMDRPSSQLVELVVRVGLTESDATDQYWALPVVEVTTLSNGLVFSTTPTDNKWVTRVESVPSELGLDLNEGDVMFGYLATGELINDRTSIADILAREIANGQTLLNFAIKRGEATWAVSFIMDSTATGTN